MNETASRRNLSRFIRKFGPIFALALFLPFLLFFAINPPRLGLTPQASGQELRLWFEPASIATTPGVPVTLSLIADTGSESTVIHSLKVGITPKQNLSITPAEVSYEAPFSGRIIVGQIQVTPAFKGNFTIDILRDKIRLNKPDIKIFVSSANMIVSQE